MYHSLAKGFWKQLYVLFGLIVGYVVSLFFGMVDFASMKATVQELGVIALPKLFAYTPKFELGAIVSVTLVFLVSAAETIGATCEYVGAKLYCRPPGCATAAASRTFP